LLSCLAFIPHLFTFWALGPGAWYSELSEVFFYLAAGVVMGLISGREHRLRRKYQDLSEKLGRSYHRLSQQASQLVDAEKQLGESRKLTLLGKVSASLAHEIKNPLASIKGATEILADEVAKDHPKYEFVEILRTEISRLNSSVEKVLDYCRGSGEKRAGARSPIVEVVAHVQSLMAERVREKGLLLEVSHHGPEGFEVEKTPMIQVLLNVLINAADAVDRGGTILVETEARGPGLLICVSDDGPGVANGLSEEIFQAFVTTKEGGTGLGLAISGKIMESLSGRIYMGESRLGGASVCIEYPEE